jgi:hypothetical protein
MLVFAPDKGMGFDEYFNIIQGMKLEDRYIAFALGLAPKATQFKYMDTSKLSFKAGKAPSLNIACQLCSAVAGTETVKIILERGTVKAVPYYYQFDPYLHKFCHKKLYLGNRHPRQRIKAILVKRMVNKNAEIKSEAPELPNMEIGGPGINPEIMRYIIRAGIQAPSGDNAQPWKFSYKDNEICLYLNKEADQSFFNVNQTASVISCGAVIENMKIAATKFGLKAEIKYCRDDTNVATLFFFKDDQIKKDILSDFIWERNTNRKLFAKTPAPHSLLVSLKSAVKEIGGADIYFITDRDRIEKLARLVSRADRIRSERQDLHEHLFNMIRFSKEEALEKRDGFYIKNLEAGLGGELFLKATRSWKMMNAANKAGMGKIVAQVAYKGIINSSGAGLIIVDGKSRESFLDGGRALARVWLAMTKAGFQLQPMTAITLFFLRKQFGRSRAFSADHALMLDEILKKYSSLFSIPQLESRGQVMLFRFGKAPQIRFGTLRQKQEVLTLS